jgi:hypothetical protein
MSAKPIVAGLVFSSIVFATASTQAQVTVDVSKVTCDQYVHMAWDRGSRHCRRGWWLGCSFSTHRAETSRQKI